MQSSSINEISLSAHIYGHPLIKDVTSLKPTFFINPMLQSFAAILQSLPFQQVDVKDASARLARFCPYLSKAFPETASMNGIIESPIKQIPEMYEALKRHYGKNNLSPNLLVKLDSHLAISGSIKARGGIYEVLKFAEDVALKHGLLGLKDDYSLLVSKKCRDVFSRYSIMVGSTGNLGLSIGIVGAELGFRVTVHMSADARTWKKQMLRSRGVEVIEHQADYSSAVAGGREQAKADSNCHFVDDENSRDLFLGYSVAAERLKKQFERENITIDSEHPLFVYLPCGVGGGPGGITYGLKLLYGDNVHCFFGEPLQAPAMLVGLATGLHDRVSAKQFGLTGQTDADGLAVSRPSGLVCKVMQNLLSGLYTVSDREMYQLLTLLARSEGIYLEPSALLGFAGYVRMADFTDKLNISTEQLRHAVHLVWATGGNMVPRKVWEQYNAKGEVFLGDKE